MYSQGVSTRYIKFGIYFGVFLFSIVFIASVYDYLSLFAFDVFKSFIFAISLWYFVWHYKITKKHVPSYDRVSEGAVICAILFNPILSFSLDLALWMFLEIVFMWIFIIFLLRIKAIEKNLAEGNMHWIDME